MNAKDLKQIADNINIMNFDAILDKLKEAAQQGKYGIVVHNKHLTKESAEKLVNFGFTVGPTGENDTVRISFI